MRSSGPTAGTRTVVLVAAAMVVPTWPATALAADAYVDDGAAGDPPGCPLANPCQHIAAGITAATSGATVHIDGGTYNESLTLGGGKSLVADEFRGVAEPETLIDGGGSDAIAVATDAGTISGFHINSDFPGSGVRLTGAANVTGNTFDDPDNSSGVSVGGGAGASTISGNLFTDPTPSDSSLQIGVSVSESSPTISGNTSSGDLRGITVSGDGADPMIEGNEITGTYSVGFGGTAIAILNDASPTLIGNFIHSPGAGSSLGIWVSEDLTSVPPTGATLARNTIINYGIGVQTTNVEGPVSLNGDLVAKSTTFGIFGYDNPNDGGQDGDITATNITEYDSASDDIALTDTDLVLDSSIVGANGVNTTSSTATCVITFSRGPTTTPGTSGCGGFQTTANPMFADAGNGDYHLLSGSPLIDMGNPALPVAPNDSDFDGDGRALAGTCGGAARRDIGADELQPDCNQPTRIPTAKDTDPPQTKLKKHPHKHSHDRTPTFELGSDESGSSFQCKLDRKKFKPCGRKKTFHVSPGKHTLKVRAVDTAGNVDPSPATFKFTVVD